MCTICADLASAFSRKAFISDDQTPNLILSNGGGLSYDNPLAWLDLDDRGGVGTNGMTSFTTTEAAAFITRSGRTWSSQLGTPVTVTYGFRSTDPGASYNGGQGTPDGFSRLSASQMAIVDLMLAAWSDVSGITFQRVGTGTAGEGAYTDSATMLFANYNENDSAAAFAYLPGSTTASSATGDVWINMLRTYNQTPTYLGYGYQTIVHEIGHAIGLSHPGDYNAGSGNPTYADATYYEDTRQYSVMSYWSESNTGAFFGQARYASAPLLDDIAAAQRLYGANMSTRTGDTVYGFNSNAGRIWYDATAGGTAQAVIFAIWDAAGNDTLDFSGYSQAGLIDLRQGHFSSVGGLQGNVSIALGAVIENAIGGSGGDTLVGNSANNTLRGNAGNDTLDGGVGQDTAIFSGNRSAYTITAGTETVNGVAYQVLTVSGPDGTDRLYNIEFLQFADGTISAPTPAAAGIRLEGDRLDNTVNGTAYADLLYGADGNDILNGGDGNDILSSGRGTDTLNGGAGIDTADYSMSTGSVTVNLGTGSATKAASEGGGTDTLNSIENVYGSVYNDVITGDANANRIEGRGGSDTLSGAGGNDILIAGAGVVTGAPDVEKPETLVNTARGTAVNIDGNFDLGNDAGFANPTTIPHAVIRGRSGGSGVEYYAFTAAAGAQAVFDIVSAAFDTVLELVDSNGNRIAVNDDDSSSTNSLLEYTFTTAGTYYIVVGAYGGGTGSTVTSSTANYNQAYVLNVSLTNHAVVPLVFAGSTLNGDDGDDILHSGAGNDTLNGGSGTDTVVYTGVRSAYTITDLGGGTYRVTGPEGTGVDTLTGVERIQFSDQVYNLVAVNVPTTGDDVLNGTEGDDVIDALGGNDTVNGLGGADLLIGGAGDDILNGGAGDDVLRGGSGADALNGGDGVDTADFSDLTAGVTVVMTANGAGTAISAGVTDVMTSIENIIGTGFADTINGNAAANRIQGGAGNDTIFGNGGIDVLEGGDGADTLVGNADIFLEEQDTLRGGSGDDIIYGERADIIDGGTGFDSLIAINAYDWTLDMAATSIEYAVMDFGNDTIDATNQTVGVSVFASGGNDVVDGSGHADLIFGGSGNDVIRGGFGNDSIVGDEGADSLDGGAGDDRIYFDAQDTFVFGGTGYDAGYITGTGSTGVVIDMGSASLEFLQDLAGGADTILGSTATQGLSIYSGAGNDTIEGSAFDDIIWADTGDDVINGGAGNDVIVGGAGSDVINGGAGNDSLYGGAGDNAADIFVFHHAGAENADAVYDFVVGQDKLDLSAFGSAFANVTISVAGSDSIVYLNGLQIATVVGVTNLTETDFVMAAPPASPAPVETALIGLDVDGFGGKADWFDGPQVRPDATDHKALPGEESVVCVTPDTFLDANVDMGGSVDLHRLLAREVIRDYDFV